MPTSPVPLALACKHVGSQAELARLLDVSPSLVNQWIAGVRPIPDKQCIEVERVTDGAYPVEVINGNTAWVRVPDPNWSHPGGRPCIDAANSASRKEVA